MVHDSGLLELHDCTIWGNRESGDIGGGVGVYAASQWELVAPTLLLEGNSIRDNAGAGVFLDDAAAVRSGNDGAQNGPDLLVQGDACHSPEDGYLEVPEAEVCPVFDRPVCELEFAWDLELADIDPALPPPFSELDEARTRVYPSRPVRDRDPTYPAAMEPVLQRLGDDHRGH